MLPGQHLTLREVREGTREQEPGDSNHGGMLLAGCSCRFMLSQFFSTVQGRLPHLGWRTVGWVLPHRSSVKTQAQGIPQLWFPFPYVILSCVKLTVSYWVINPVNPSPLDGDIHSQGASFLLRETSQEIAIQLHAKVCLLNSLSYLLIQSGWQSILVIPLLF